MYLQGAQVEAAKNLSIKGGAVTIAAAVNEAGLKVGNSSSKKSGVSSALHDLDSKGENIPASDVTRRGRLPRVDGVGCVRRA